MADERQIDAISIAIGANIVGLKEQLAEAQRLVSGFKFRPPGQANLPFMVVVNDGTAQTKIKALTVERTVKINAVLNPTQESIVGLRKSVKEELTTEGGGIQVPFTAD